MPRRIDITVAPDETNDLIASLAQETGIVSLTVDRGAAVKPQGDSVTLIVANRWLADITRALQRQGIGRDERSTLTTSAPVSVVSAPHAKVLQSDTNDGTWEEMDAVMNAEAGANVNVVAVMTLSGALAAVGLATGALHIVIAAMVIAPGFEPITRVGLALTARGETWRQGALAAAGGYGGLVVGAFVVALFLRLIDQPLLGGRADVVSSTTLVSFWSSITATSLFVSVAAALAGALLIVANRSELTLGAMIALSLIPALALVPLALMSGDLQLAASASLRWLLDVVIVFFGGVAMFLWKRVRLQRRSTSM